jgi:hypothetical protein
MSSLISDQNATYPFISLSCELTGGAAPRQAHLLARTLNPAAERMPARFVAPGRAIWEAGRAAAGGPAPPAGPGLLHEAADALRGLGLRPRVGEDTPEGLFRADIVLDAPGGRKARNPTSYPQ